MIKTQPTPVDTTPDQTDVLGDVELAVIKKRSVVGALSYFGRTAVLQLIGLIASLILSALFSPEDFGIYGFVVQIIGLLVFFSDIGLAAALIQKKQHPTLKEYRVAFTVQQLLSWLIVAVVGMILATGVVQQKTGSVGAWVLISLAISFPLATLKTIPSIMLERKLDFSKLVLPQIFEQIVFYSVLIWLAIQGMGALAYAYAIIARTLIGVIVMTLIQPWKFGFSLNLTVFKELASYGIKFQLADFLARIKDQLFYIALALFLPLKEFGYVQWAKTWSQYPYTLTVQNVLAVTFPTFSRLQKNQDALKKAIEKSIFFITLAIFPILIGMSLFIWPLTIVVPSYAKWQPAVLSFIFFTLSIGWSALSTPLVNTLNAIGQINSTLKLMLIWTGLTWMLSPLAIWQLGYNGVAVTALLISLTSFLPLWYLKKSIQVYLWDQVWRQLFAASMMAIAGLIGWSWWSRSLWWLLLGMGVTSLSYVLAFLIVGYRKIELEVKSLGVKI